MPRLRPFRPGDEQGICELFAACHGRPLSSALRTWRYATQNGRPAVIDVAEHDGRVVAHLGALPVALRRGQEALAAGMWADLMVHPDHRNLSLFLDMAEANRERCAQAGMKIVFAFPNDRSYPLLKRMLGWSAIEEIDALEAPLADLKAVPGEATVDDIAEFTDEHERLQRRLSPKDSFAAERARDWLNWRYRRRPERTYAAWSARAAGGELRGWLTAHVFDGPDGRVGDILDLWAEPDACGALWSKTLGHFKAAGVKTVSGWALKESLLYARYTGWGLAPRGPRTHFAGRWASSAERAAFPARGSDWHVSKGDSDVF